MKVPTLSSDRATETFSSKANVIGNLAPLLNKLKWQKEPVSVVSLSDSTGNGTTRFIYQLVQIIKTYWPDYTFQFAQWNGTSYDAPTVLQTGTKNTFTWYNGAVSGSTTAYFQGVKGVAGLSNINPDLVFINYGHNQITYVGTDLTNATTSFRQGVEGSMLSLIESIRETCPGAGIVATIQNPAVANIGQRVRAGIYMGLFNRTGVGYVDTLSAFINADGSVKAELIADGVHPTTEGSLIQARLWANSFKPRDTVEPVLYGAPSSTKVGFGLLEDPYFTNFLDVPQSSTNVTIDRSTSIVENLASPYSMQLTPTGVSQSTVAYNATGSVANYVGKWVTFWVRQYIPAGSAVTSGRIAISDGVTSVVSDSSALEAPDRWITTAISMKISTGASYVRFTIYGGTTTEGFPLYISQMHAVLGREPVLSAPRPGSQVPRTFNIPYSTVGGYDFNGSTGSGTVLNNAAFNFGTSNFGITLAYVPKFLTSAAKQPLVNCFSGNNGWKLSITTTGLLEFSIGDGTTFINYQSTIAIAGNTRVGSYTPIAVSINRTGSVTFFVGGRQLGNAVSIAASSAISVTTAGNLQIGVDGALYGSYILSGVALYNGLIDASFHGVTGISAVRRWGGAVPYTSNFSAGTDGWVVTNVTNTGNQDAVVDDALVSVDNALLATATVTSGSHLTGKYSIIAPSTNYRITLSYYIPTDCPTLRSLRFFSNPGNNLSAILPDLTVRGLWTTVSRDFTSPSDMTGFSLRGLDAGGATTWAGAAGAPFDRFYVKDVVITAIGAIVGYEANAGSMLPTVWLEANPGVSAADMLMSSGAVLNNPTMLGAARIVAADTTLTRYDKSVAVDTSGGVRIITLPLASQNYGMRVTIKRLGATNAVTIARTGSDTFYDTAAAATSLSIAADGGVVTLEADGANNRWLRV